MTALPRLLLTCCLALAAGGCARDISPAPADGGSGGSGDTPIDETGLPGPGGAQSSFTRNAGGYYSGSVDSSGSEWVYIDIDQQLQVTPADPAASDAWDIAFKGVEIKLNGGVSGTPPTGFAAQAYGDKVAAGTAYGFEGPTAAPPGNAVTYRSDETTGLLPLPLPVLGQSTAYVLTTYPAADQAPDASGAGDHGWYRQASVTAGSAITPRGNVGYFLRSVQCHYFKLRLTGYAGGRIGFDVQPVSGSACAAANEDNAVAPLGHAAFATTAAGSQQVAVDASDDTEWVHLDLSKAAQAVPSAPSADPSGWDIALRRTDIKVNGGTSGTGRVEIWDGLRDNWDARTSAPVAATYHTDAGEAYAFITYPPAERGGSAACANINGDFGWYYYSGFCNDGDGIHHISPREVVYVVHDKAGASWKLRVLDYYSDIGSGHYSIEYATVTGF